METITLKFKLDRAAIETLRDVYGDDATGSFNLKNALCDYVSSCIAAANTEGDFVPPIGEVINLPKKGWFGFDGIELSGFGDE